MVRGLSIFLLMHWLAVTGAAIAQQRRTTSKPIPISPDRAADSYAIYSRLVTSGESNDRRTKVLYLIEADTTTVPKNSPCEPADQDQDLDSYNNPRGVPMRPVSGSRILPKCLLVTDSRCHESVKLAGDQLKITLPFRLSAVGGERFRSNLLGRNGEIRPAPEPTGDYDGANGLLSFSEVYFNHDHIPRHGPDVVVRDALWNLKRWVVLEKQTAAGAKCNGRSVMVS